MKWTSLTAPLVLTCVLLLPPAALAAGGPVPPAQNVSIGAPGSPERYVPFGGGRGTLVVQLKTGTVVSELRVPGHYGVPGVGFDGSLTGLSADGRTLVLAGLTGNTAPTETRLLVLDTTPRLAARARIELPGWSTVDAISPNGRWLYLIHYQRSDIAKYEVQAYDLRMHRLLPQPIVDPHDRDEAMTGLAVTRVMSADRRWAYTLYMRPSGAPFVHALDTVGRRAVCVDLPVGANADIANARLTIRPGGGSLRISADGVTRALVDLRTFHVATGVVRQPSAPVRRLPRERVAARTSGGIPWTLLAVVIAALGVLAAAIATRPTRVDT